LLLGTAYAECIDATSRDATGIVVRVLRPKCDAWIRLRVRCRLHGIMNFPLEIPSHSPGGNSIHCNILRLAGLFVRVAAQDAVQRRRTHFRAAPQG